MSGGTCQAVSRWPGPAYCAGAWLTRAENVGRGKVVPGTTLADLDHIYPELAVFGRHLGQFRALLYPAGVVAEFVPVHVGDVGELVLRQIGQAVSVASPWNLAARSR